MTEIRFGTPFDATPPGQGGFVVITYPVTITVRSADFGYDKTSDHQVSVQISRSLHDIWRYEPAELLKVLFTYALQMLQDRLAAGNLSEHENFELHTGNTPKKRPIDPAKIPEPNGAVFQIDPLQNKRIGF
jgi:hypothetical protein